MNIKTWGIRLKNPEQEEALKYYPLPNHPNYFVTKKGNVYLTKAGVYKKLKPALHNAGYLAIMLAANNGIYSIDNALYWFECGVLPQKQYKIY
ncbi:MAG: hypothetical protein WCP65_00190 [Bacteroidota bacterium]